MNTRQALLAVSCIVFNLILAKIAALLALPVYLDSVGTIISVALMPWFLSIAIGISTSIVGAIVIDPHLVAYCGTQLTIAVVAIFCFRAGLFATWLEALVSGVLIALSSVIVSAPVTVLLFEGVTWSETNAITAILLASGKNIWQSVIQGAVFIESIDKPSASLLAWFMAKRLRPVLAVKKGA